jgi:hypothetical protein
MPTGMDFEGLRIPPHSIEQILHSLPGALMLEQRSLGSSCRDGDRIRLLPP